MSKQSSNHHVILKVDALSQLEIDASSCMKDILSYTPRFDTTLRNKVNMVVTKTIS